jgi:hypothetical protein
MKNISEPFFHVFLQLERHSERTSLFCRVIALADAQATHSVIILALLSASNVHIDVHERFGYSYFLVDVGTRRWVESLVSSSLVVLTGRDMLFLRF